MKRRGSPEEVKGMMRIFDGPINNRIERRAMAQLLRTYSHATLCSYRRSL